MWSIILLVLGLTHNLCAMNKAPETVTTFAMPDACAIAIAKSCHEKMLEGAANKNTESLHALNRNSLKYIKKFINEQNKIINVLTDSDGRLTNKDGEYCVIAGLLDDNKPVVVHALNDALVFINGNKLMRQSGIKDTHFTSCAIARVKNLTCIMSHTDQQETTQSVQDGYLVQGTDSKNEVWSWVLAKDAQQKVTHVTFGKLP